MLPSRLGKKADHANNLITPYQALVIVLVVLYFSAIATLATPLSISLAAPIIAYLGLTIEPFVVPLRIFLHTRHCPMAES
jgi:hypothetical protein